ncbi:MAG: type II/IV secretion system protein [Planctomycetes bacterium]|nr:type II/IV secretion system protein [Planctomycetota bacterium]
MSSQALERVLLDSGTLTQEGLDKVRALARSRGMSLERAAVQLGHDESRVYRDVSKAYGLPFGDPEKAKPEAIERIPKEQIEQNNALPLLIKSGVLYVAIDDPINTFVADNLGFIAGCEVKCAIAPPEALKRAIRKVVGGGSAAGAPRARGKGDARGEPEGEDAPILRLVDKTINEALAARASDIHVEPFESRMRVRYRVDGVLREVASLEPGLHGPFTSRFKIMAKLDIAERRKPQDGRIAFRSSEGREIDIRTSVLPGNHGETLVMRLLDKEKNLLSLADLGFGGIDEERFQRTIKRPNGVFLVTGPTGSGKTTTLYAALKQLNRPDVKIITAEDPVEFNIAGINQCQVRSGIGLTFARILRAMLRQAPNIILVGEIRDRETAEIAVQAALTGHLVFASLHTNDAPSAVTRLIDIGVKPFLVSAAIQAIMAQRLVRVLCKDCRRPYTPDETDLVAIGLSGSAMQGATFNQPVGCPACEHTGYRGRVGLFELMSMDTTLREMTFRQESTLALRHYARSSGGMTTLVEDGAKKVAQGITSVEEILRVTSTME